MFTFEHPANGYRETVSDWSALWALLFGPLYLGLRGLWAAALTEVAVSAALLVAFREPGLMFVAVWWFAVALATPGMLRRYYLRSGWRSVK